MGRLHEAISKAEVAYTKSLVPVAADRSGKKLRLVGQRPGLLKLNGNGNGFANLKTRITSLRPERSVKTIMFTGITHGIGVTSTVVKFGQTLAGVSGLKVLVIDANLSTPGLHRRFNIVNDNGMAELLVDEDIKVFQFKKVGQGELYAFTCGKNYSDEIGNFESKRFDKLLQTARDRFDYVILDSAPIMKFSETQIISAKVDAVLLVIEAGKTRKQVALRAKEDLEQAGGNLLGVVMNKRKYHIPDWIYKRL
jgi:capsular exopolysaccharide synthesis family protein